MYAVVYHDEINAEIEILGLFNKKENAKTCLDNKKIKLIDELVACHYGYKEDDFGSVDSWGITYDGGYYDTCEIKEVSAPED